MNILCPILCPISYESLRSTLYVVYIKLHLCFSITAGNVVFCPISYESLRGIHYITLVFQHHCRKCGKAVCNKCSRGRSTLYVVYIKLHLCFSTTAGNVVKQSVINVAEGGALFLLWDMKTMSEFVILVWKPSLMKSKLENI